MKTITTYLSLSIIAACLSSAAFAAPAKNYGFDEELPPCAVNTKLPVGVEFTEIFPECGFSGGYPAPVVRAEKYGFADRTGKIVIPLKFDEAHSFSDDLALIKQGGKYGYIDQAGKVVIRPQFENAWGFWEDRAKFAEKGKYGFIDTKGDVVIKPTFTETGHWFESGFLVVKQGDKYGYINKSGKMIIEPQFDLAKDFSESRALVGKKTGEVDAAGKTLYQYSFIDQTGKVVIPVIYDYASEFFNGAAYVLKDGESRYIDKDNNTTAMPSY